MNIHEYGKEHKKVIVLIHPSLVMWDYFEHVIPLLENDCHIIVPALPGYDQEKPCDDFTSVEKIAEELIGVFIKNKIDAIDVLYGCSMGGSIVLKMLSSQKILVKNAICDGGITPYNLPWIVTRLIAVRDFLMICIGKIGGLKLLEKVFSTDEYSEEDLKYIFNVLDFASYQTIWRTFESCNNYSMPRKMPAYQGKLEYWYGEKEEKYRAWDIKYVEKAFPHTEFIKLKNRGHASMAPLYPQEMAERLMALSDS
ncbi:MAG: alpha/beta hydrolase [Eubacteriaceae bacterium]|jgi:pimeloyl-ACP methyl ester carboxylesterase|nr:alpha/beta hydrolase [Eubacteriaceae bacterium]